MGKRFLFLVALSVLALFQTAFTALLWYRASCLVTCHQLEARVPISDKICYCVKMLNCKKYHFLSESCDWLND